MGARATPSVLAGDIGGTKTILSLYDRGSGRPEPLAKQKFPSADFPNLTELVRQFLEQHGARVERACFGIAGPVQDDRVEATNLPWVIEARAMERELSIERVVLLNDFHAVAYGIERLAPSELLSLNPGARAPRGPKAILGAGTGLGEAFLFWTGGRYEVVASEGGHADFAPRSAIEIELLQDLIARFGRVSYERVLSGPGLANLYDFLRRREPERESAELRAALERSDDPAPIISEFGLAGRDPLAEQTLDLFAAVYGAEAGNLALKVVATGGVYVAGGIAPRIQAKLKQGAFQDAYRSKGRLSDLVRAIPVDLVLNPEVGLLGAALIASRE